VWRGTEPPPKFSDSEEKKLREDNIYKRTEKHRKSGRVATKTQRRGCPRAATLKGGKDLTSMLTHDQKRIRSTGTKGKKNNSEIAR